MPLINKISYKVTGDYYKPKPKAQTPPPPRKTQLEGMYTSKQYQTGQAALPGTGGYSVPTNAGNPKQLLALYMDKMFGIFKPTSNRSNISNQYTRGEAPVPGMAGYTVPPRGGRPRTARAPISNPYTRGETPVPGMAGWAVPQMPRTTGSPVNTPWARGELPVPGMAGWKVPQSSLDPNKYQKLNEFGAMLSGAKAPPPQNQQQVYGMPNAYNQNRQTVYGLPNAYNQNQQQVYGLPNAYSPKQMTYNERPTPNSPRGYFDRITMNGRTYWVPNQNLSFASDFPWETSNTDYRPPLDWKDTTQQWKESFDNGWQVNPMVDNSAYEPYVEGGAGGWGYGGGGWGGGGGGSQHYNSNPNYVGYSNYNNAAHRQNMLIWNI